jgi:GMP synthase (glutamine-hydrolysing)
MTMAPQLGGEVEGGHHREFGRADVEVKAASPLFEGVWEAWASASGLDEPRRPRHQDAARLSRHRHLAERAVRVIADEKRKFYGAACSTPRWCTRRRRQADLRNFVRKIAALTGDWTMRAFARRRSRRSAQVGKGG